MINCLVNCWHLSGCAGLTDVLEPQFCDTSVVHSKIYGTAVGVCARIHWKQNVPIQ